MESKQENINKQYESLESACEKYKLSQKQHDYIGNNINNIFLEGKVAVDNPIAIIDIAPPGSGKTGLNGMGLKQFKKDNAVIINSDELKPFHPKIDEIAKLYPQFYTKVTNQESNPWTDALFEKAVECNYNIIFEGTGRNIKLLKKMIDKMSNYKIIVRAMSVNELNCLMSIVERYEGQVKKKGWGRLVTLDHFYKAYDEIVDTIQQIEDLDIVDVIEVYTRGDGKTLSPIRIYNSNIKQFNNAKLAVINGRYKDKGNASKYFEEKFSKSFYEDSELLEETEILHKIRDLYSTRENKEDEIEL